MKIFYKFNVSAKESKDDLFLKKSFLKFVNLIPEKIKGIGNKMKMTTLFPPHFKKILCPKNE